MPDLTPDASADLVALDRAARDAADHTPLMRQWLDFKKEVGELILFFRVGDFYELFWEDAELASRLLDLTLTRRGSSGGRPIAMSGVPWHALDLHLARLLRMGRGAAVVDQVSEPGLTKGPVDRAISRVITPGTLLDDALLDEKRDAPLLAVAQDARRGLAGLFWISLSSGSACHCVAPLSELADEIARVQPAEILLAEGEQLDGGAGRASLSRLPSWRFDPAGGQERLQQHFGVANLDGFGGLSGSPLALAAACAAYSHAQASLGGKRPNLLTLRESSPGSRLAMDAATRRALEINETQSGQSSPTLFSTLDLCSSPMGSRRLRLWISEPPAQWRESAARHDAVDALLQSSGAADALREAIGRMADIERASGRAAAGLARPRDFSNLRAALREFGAMREALAPLAARSAKIARVAEGLGEQPETLAFLEDAIAEEPAVHIRDGGVIREGHSAELDELRELSSNSEGALAAMEAREREATGIANLRIEFNRAHGFQIEITRSQADKAPAHYQRRQTLKNAERYTTPELTELERKVLGAQEGALKLEKSLFEQAQATLAQLAPALADAALQVSELDALLAFAQAAAERNYCKPAFTHDGAWRVRAARHPVVELLGDEPFVPNDLALDAERQTLLITGPNMGGKSTYMRAAGLLALMSRAGSFVPADSCELPPVSRICARVGSGDDIARNRSTFMVEMTEAASILRHADSGTLCLIDEIGRGTSTYDGMALAWAILRHLTQENGAKTLFSTHYLELSELAESLPGVANVHLEAERGPRGIVFLRRLRPGAASQSHGIEVARLAGLPGAALSWAEELLATLHGQGSPKLADALSGAGHLARSVADAHASSRPAALAGPVHDGGDGETTALPQAPALVAGAIDAPAAAPASPEALPSEPAARAAETVPAVAPAVEAAPAAPAADPLGAALREAIEAIDPDDLTPRAALDAVYALRRMLRDAKSGKRG
jgi:DNA mismatch repair protein MutS